MRDYLQGAFVTAQADGITWAPPRMYGIQIDANALVMDHQLADWLQKVGGEPIRSADGNHRNNAGSDELRFPLSGGSG